MNLEKIKENILKHYDYSLQGVEARKIVYWIDVEGAFLESFRELDLGDIKKHEFTSNNQFYTKYLLEEEDTESNYLIYTTSNLKINLNNWLSDNILYSDKFYADEVSNIIRDLGIPDSLRKIISDNVKFFRNKERYRRFESYNIEKYDEDVIDKAMVCVLCKYDNYNFEEALRRMLASGFEENKFLQDIYKFFDEDRFWNILKKDYGYSITDHSLKKFMTFLLITSSSFKTDETVLINYTVYVGKVSRNNCMTFVDRWMNDINDISNFKVLSKIIENEFTVENALKDVDIDKIKNIEVFMAVDMHIVRYISNSLINKNEEYAKYLELISIRKNKCFYSDFQDVYDALFYAIKMFEFKNNKEYLIKADSASGMVENYSKNLYKMDTYYRKFYFALDDKRNNFGKDIIKEIQPLIENLYSNWYLFKLSSLFSDELQKNYSAGMFKQKMQKDFFKNVIDKHIINKEKVFVIISDAMRYEVACELEERMKTENKGLTTIEPMISAIPSSTKFGMASLLPHKEIEYKENHSVFVDGMDSSSFDNRAKILESNCSNSLVLEYNDIMKMNSTELKKVSIGQKVIYIYHNSIDAIGDSASTEIQTFDGCEKAVNELANLVLTLKNNMSATTLYITSDHGFIYVRDKLEEIDKIAKDNDFEESKRRYAIGNKEYNNDSLLKFNLSDVCANSDLAVFTPKDNMRFKTQGSGANFVHGGASLHEMVIPLIAYKNKKTGQKGALESKKTEIKLTSTMRKITNSIFKLEFIQTEAVIDRILPISIKLYFIDQDENIVSNEVLLMGDVKENDPIKRSLKANFTLKNMRFKREKKYYLVMKDVETDVEYEHIIFNIDVAIDNDFGF